MTSNPKKYTHTHTHDAFSLRDSVLKLDEAIAKVKQDGQNALAITNHGNLYSHIQFYKKAKEAGIKPIIGIEAYCVKDRFFKGKIEPGQKRANHLILLCETTEGYHNLLKIVSRSNDEGFYFTPRIDKQLLRKYSKGLICTSGCLGGDIQRAILAKDLKLAESLIEEYIDIFGKNNFFLEVMDNGFEGQKEIISISPKLAKKYGIRVIATQDAHYLNREDRVVQKALKCIDRGLTLEELEAKGEILDECYLKTAEEMYALFPENPEWCEVTQEIADRCNVEIKSDRIVFPEFVKGKEEKEELLAELCRRGWKKLISGIVEDSKLKEYGERVVYEMGVINKNNFTDYFLIVQDITRFARSKDIPQSPGRGSVCGSLVAFLLGITEVDPIKYDLYFSRFLNESRVSPPDIDLDFADDRREEVIEYTRQKYGKDKFVKTLTFGNFQPKSALRDALKLYGESIEVQSSVSSLVPIVLQGVPNIRFKHLYGEDKNFPNAKQPKLLEAKEKYPEAFFLAEKLEGNPRQASTHASAYILADKSIDNYAPLDYDSKNEDFRIGIDMYSAEEIKLLKMDFLGIETLAIVDSAIKTIKKRHGVEIDLSKLPLDDEKTWNLIATGDTIGIFQFESDGIRSLLKKAMPSTLLELADCNALYRPGAAKFIPEYCMVKSGQKKIEYMHPLMEPVLKSTYGVLIYQESVMKMCQVLAGFTLPEADYMRKAIGKKKQEDMEKLFPMFKNGCAKNGIDEELVQKILSWFHDMSRYNFNKSHALAYALNAYRSAYVKAHFPLEFCAEMLNKKTAEKADYMIRFMDAKKRGIKVYGPNVNKSEALCTLIDNQIYFGLSLMRGAGSLAIEGIIKEREANGLYTSYEDLLLRTYKFIEKTTLEDLILTGALDEFGINRKWAVDKVEGFLKAFRKQKNVDARQVDMFTDKETFALPDKDMFTQGQTEDYEKREKLEKEKEVIGFYASGSPLDAYRFTINTDEFVTSNQIAQKDDDELVEIGAIVSEVRKFKDKNSNDMAFASLSDDFGSVKSVIFTKQYNSAKSLLKVGEAVRVKGWTSQGQIKVISFKKLVNLD